MRSRWTCSRCRTTPRCSRATRTSGASTSPTRPPGSRTSAGSPRCAPSATTPWWTRWSRTGPSRRGPWCSSRLSACAAAWGSAGARTTCSTRCPVAPPPPAPDGREPHQVELIGSLGAAFGVAPDADLSPRLYLADAASGRRRRTRWAAATPGGRAHGPRVLINVSISPARAPWRRWPVDRLRRARRPPAPRSTRTPPSWCSRCRTIATRPGSSPPRGGGVAREPSLREMFALVAAADLVFTPDTGVVHVASAFGTPAVVVTLPEALSVRAVPHPRRDAGARGPGHRADRARTGGGRAGRRARDSGATRDRARDARSRAPALLFARGSVILANHHDDT